MSKQKLLFWKYPRKGCSRNKFELHLKNIFLIKEIEEIRQREGQKENTTTKSTKEQASKNKVDVKLEHGKADKDKEQVAVGNEKKQPRRKHQLV